MNIPNLPIGEVLKEDKNFTDAFLDFFITLIKTLQLNLGNEGLVPPTQTAANISTIQDNQLPNGSYTCQFGTILYDSTNNTMRMAIDDGAGAPIFKTVTLT
jgi:hypothetical protein